MFAYDQAFSLRCLRPSLRYPSVLVIGDPPLRRHYWASGLKQGLEHLGQKATLRCLDSGVPGKFYLEHFAASTFQPAAWEGDVIDLVEVTQPMERLAAGLIRSSLIVLVVSGNIAALKNAYAWIKHCSTQFQKQRFYLLGDAPTPKGGSVCEHLKQVTQRFLPSVELISLSHMSEMEGRVVSFRSTTPMTLYTRVFRQLAFMLYDSVLFESAPSEMPNRMSKEHHVASS